MRKNFRRNIEKITEIFSENSLKYFWKSYRDIFRRIPDSFVKSERYSVKIPWDISMRIPHVFFFSDSHQYIWEVLFALKFVRLKMSFLFAFWVGNALSWIRRGWSWAARSLEGVMKLVFVVGEVIIIIIGSFWEKETK